MVSAQSRDLIRLARPELGEAEEAEVAEVLRSGHLVQGPRVARFEAALAARLAAPHVAAVSSGTAALHVALMALGIGRGDKVAVPTFSWPATANVVELIGATPIFVDIEETTFGMDPGRLVEAINLHGDLRAVMPVHAFGGMAQIRQITEIAARHGIPVVEDAACALGAELDGIPAGLWGAAGCFSFHPRKAVTTGEGGAVVLAEPGHLSAVRALRNHGIDPDAMSVDFIVPGFNYRLSEMQAAMGEIQLTRLKSLLTVRRALAAVYQQHLTSVPVATPDALSPSSHIFQSYVVLLPEGTNRKKVIDLMRDSGVETTIGTYHIPLLTYYRNRYGFSAGDHPVGESIAERALALPMHARLREADVERVVVALRSAL